MSRTLRHKKLPDIPCKYDYVKYDVVIARTVHSTELSSTLYTCIIIDYKTLINKTMCFEFILIQTTRIVSVGFSRHSMSQDIYSLILTIFNE